MRASALTAGIRAVLTGVAEPFRALVDLNPDGLGQVVIYPYYAVVGATPRAPVFPVEVGAPGGRCLNPFNLFLSDDIWTYVA